MRIAAISADESVLSEQKKILKERIVFRKEEDIIQRKEQKSCGFIWKAKRQVKRL